MARATGFALSVLLGLASACALAAPAAAPVPAPELSLLNDARFGPPSVAVGTNDLFALSDAMKAYLRETIEPKVAAAGRHRALIDALYAKSQLKLRYDSSVTRDAAQAFDDRAGNCLSLVVMTAAFAKAMDLTVTFRKVLVEDALGRDGNIYFAIGHVNLTLSRHPTDLPGYGTASIVRGVEPDRMTVDFLAPQDMRTVRTRRIGEETIAAMFANNRAVEALARGEVVDAYWWARESLLRDPGFAPAVNTLGVVYARHGDAADAERALRYVLELDPGNTLALSNLVAVLAENGRTVESQQLAATLHRLDPEPPFSWYIRGRRALQEGDYRAAKDAFAKEVARAPDFHEFHFWLAIAHLALGERKAAQGELELAIETSTTSRDQDLYASKLARLARENRAVR